MTHLESKFNFFQSLKKYGSKWKGSNEPMAEYISDNQEGLSRLATGFVQYHETVPNLRRHNFCYSYVQTSLYF